jgi:hypothetical protein
MLVALGIDISTARFDFFWDTCDRNGDGLVRAILHGVCSRCGRFCLRILKSRACTIRSTTKRPLYSFARSLCRRRRQLPRVCCCSLEKACKQLKLH